MSTNVYRTRHIVYYSTPKSRYGWKISTSGDSLSIEYFASTDDQNAFCKAVAERCRSDSGKS